MPFVLEAGREVGGCYALDRLLGEGGMGEVWAAHHTATQLPVALKFLKDGALDPHARRRLLKEARASSAVKHPGVVAVHEVIESDGGPPALVMELLVGESLGAQLERDKKLSCKETARVMLPVAQALAAAHAAGVVHRDLKPDNVFITTQGEMKVLDFGIAKRVHVDVDTARSIGTQTGALIGTPMYMSPEQAFGEANIDHRTDVWSLGLILYECLTGVLPTRADNLGQVLKIVLTSNIRPLGELAPDVPAELASLVDHMLLSDRAARLQSMAEVAAALSSIANGSGMDASSPAQLIVRVSDSDSGDAWAVTQTPSEERPADSSSDTDSFLRAVAATSTPALVQPEPDRSGQRISHYEVVRKLGQGGMGIVYLANDVRLRRKVALKVLPIGVVMNDDRRRRFLREARSASAVQHPHVATVFDVGESDGAVYLAMEYVDGPTLRKYLETNGGKLEVRKALALALQIARGLARAHEAGVIHRDVKPENVMIASEGSAKVLDFGLAKLSGSVDDAASLAADGASEEFASRVGHVLGTPAYMSPEQAAGRPVDARTDVYAMGVVFHEMLLGHRPPKGDRAAISSSGTRLSLPITRVIERCLSVGPEDRFPDAGALANELSRIEATIAAGEQRRWWPMAGAAALAASAVLGLFVWGPGASPSADTSVPEKPAPSPTTAVAVAETQATQAAPRTSATVVEAEAVAQPPDATASVTAAARAPARPGSLRSTKARTSDPLSQQK